MDGLNLVRTIDTEAWRSVLRDPTFYRLAWSTVQTVIIVLVLVGVLGLTAGYFLARFVTNRKLQALLLMLAILPFWTSYLIRIITWQPLFGNSGVINFLLGKAGLPQMELFLFNQRAMIFAMTSLYVVFVVGPVFWALSRIDPEVIAASRSLGASAWTTFRTVELPLARGGLVVGSLLRLDLPLRRLRHGPPHRRRHQSHALGCDLAVRRIRAVAGRRHAGSGALRDRHPGAGDLHAGLRPAPGTVGSRPVQLSRGQRIFRVVGGAVFALILVILYAPFLIMGILSFAERTTAVFPPSDFSFISYQKLFNPNDFSLYRIPGEPLVNYLRPIGLSVTLALLTSVLATICAMMAALAFRERFPAAGRSSMRFCSVW